jgi:hypothetical protein
MSLFGLVAVDNLRIVIPRIRASVRLTERAFSTSSTKLASEEELSAARRWLQDFNDTTLPRSIGDVSYSRSSGPGGQNVNKYLLPQFCKPAQKC